MSLLVVDGVTRRFGEVAALDGVSLALPVGGRLAVVGPSGSGKTTLLRLVAGFEAPDAGRLVLDGVAVAQPGRTVPAHRRGIGLVAQDGALFPHLSVGDNIGFGLPRRAPDRTRRIAGLMALVELDAGMAARRPDQLSGGQQQRVALARALAMQPRLLLLDEPFSALDAGLRAEVRAVVASALRQAGTAAILVTHDREEALSFADSVAVLDRGRLLQLGAPEDLYWRPRNAVVAAMLGDVLLLPADVEGDRARCLLGQVMVDETASGRATLMVRPEQVSLTVSPDGPALIADVQFRGATHTLVLEQGGHRLALSGSHAASWALPPQAGQRVTIEISGAAHILR